MNYVFRRLVSGDVSREWTDVARQCRRRYQFAASNVVSIVRGLANRHGVALHAAPTTPAASTAAASAAPAVASIASIALVTSALALCCPDLYDMFSESLGIFRLEVESANSCKPPKSLRFLLFRPVVSSKGFKRAAPHDRECIFFFHRVRRGSDDPCNK